MGPKQSSKPESTPTQAVAPAPTQAAAPKPAPDLTGQPETKGTPEKKGTTTGDKLKGLTENMDKLGIMKALGDFLREYGKFMNTLKSYGLPTAIKGIQNTHTINELEKKIAEQAKLKKITKEE
ncbi:hypothetical protein KKD70_00630, partial [Patescibacteria group bacterium]|nr:hypothetical protein [Patescibacteria group bacterium]